MWLIKHILIISLESKQQEKLKKQHLKRHEENVTGHEILKGFLY